MEIIRDDPFKLFILCRNKVREVLAVADLVAIVVIVVTVDFVVVLIIV